MDAQTIRQLHGGVELAEDGMMHGSSRIEAVQLGIAQLPYAVLKQVRPLAGPVRMIERMQYGITVTVYATVRVVSWAAAAAGKRGLAALEEREEREERRA